MKNLNVPRENLPQIDDHEAFVEWLRKNYIDWRTYTSFPLETLRATQPELDLDKVDAIRKGNRPLKPLVVSMCGHVLDGHHRFAAAVLNKETMGVFVVYRPIADLIGLARQFVTDTTVTENLNIPKMKTFLEFCTENDADLLFEKTVKDAAGDPAKVLNLTARIKSVPIHTRKTLVPTDIDKIKPTDPEDFLVGEDYLGPTFDASMGGTGAPNYTVMSFGEDDLPENAAIREWANRPDTQHMFIQAHGTKGRQKLMETAAILAERLGLDEKKTPEAAFKVVDKQRQLHGHDPIFFDEPPAEPVAEGIDDGYLKDKKQTSQGAYIQKGDRSTKKSGKFVLKPPKKPVDEDVHLPSRQQPEIHDIKAKYASKLMSWGDAHKELLKRGVPVPEIAKHLGVRESKVDKVMSVVKGKGGKFVKKSQTMLGTPKDVIDTEPTLTMTQNRLPL